MGVTVLLVYASRYGQTQKIASRIADVAQEEGAAIQLWNFDAMPRPLDLASFDVVVVAGPVIWGWHPRSLRRFIRQNLAQLSAVRAILVSVSGAASSEAGRPVAEEYANRLSRTSGWIPESVVLFGGGVPFSRYGFVTRVLMKILEPKYGRSGDATRDHDYTDWDAVDRFARSLAIPSGSKRIVA